MGGCSQKLIFEWDNHHIILEGIKHAISKFNFEFITQKQFCVWYSSWAP